MARTKQASKRNRRSKAVPVLGAAGLSLSLASGASASTSGAAADVSPQNTLSESPNLSRRGGNLGRELVDILRFRQGEYRATSGRRKSRLGLPVRMRRLPMRRMPVRLERLRRLRRLRRLLLVLGFLPLVLDQARLPLP